MRRKLLAILLILTMTMNTGVLSAFAAALADSGSPSSGLVCTHHQAHTAACGFSPAADAIPCDMDCTETDADGHIIHQAGCAYAPAAEGSPCTFDPAACPICQEEPAADAPQCICTTPCTSENGINSDCPVCSAEGADLSACLGQAEVDKPAGLDKNTDNRLLTKAMLTEGAHTHDDVAFTAMDSDFTGGALEGNLYLDCDVTLESSITVAADKSLTLCLNGQTLSRTGTVIEVNSGGTLTICDCTGNGKLTSNDSIGINNNGTVTITGGTIHGYQYGIKTSGGNVTVAGGAVSSQSSSSIYAYGSSGTGRVTVTGGTVSNSNAYGIYSSGCAINISGGNISSQNHAALKSYSQPIYLSGAPTITSNGSAIYLESSAMLYAHSSSEPSTAYSGDPLIITLDPYTASKTVVSGVTDGNKDNFSLADRNYVLTENNDGNALIVKATDKSLTFYGEDGNMLSGGGYPNTAGYNTKITLPALPAKDGSLAAGWLYSTDSGRSWNSTIWQSDQDTIQSDTCFKPYYVTAFAGGNGSAESPYTIASAEQLQSLAQLVNTNTSPYSSCYYQLTADIDLASVCGTATGGSWTPIGQSETTPFKGVFDGNNKTLSNLSINAPSNSYQGLFGCLSADYGSSSCAVKNLTLADAAVTGDTRVAGIAGHSDYAAISGCTVGGTVSGNSAVGGITGYSRYAAITGCTVGGTISGGSQVGGITGTSYYAAITDCTVSGAVSGRSNVDAVAGSRYDGTLENNSTENCKVIVVPPTGYTTDANGLMAWSQSGTTLDVDGFYKGNWIQTTYSNNGYEIAKENISNVASQASFINDGRYVQLSYTVTADDDAPITDGKLAVNADVKIGSNDRAAIEAILDAEGKVIGLKMVDDNNANDSYDAQFNLYFAGAGGVTPVSTYWFGHYSNRSSNNFNQLSTGTKSGSGTYDAAFTKYSGADSGMAFSWQGIAIPAGESKTYSVILGVGEKSDPPQWQSEGKDSPISLTLAAEQHDLSVNVSAQVTHVDGQMHSLYYDTNGGISAKLGDFTAGSDADTIAEVLDVSGLSDGRHDLHFWVVNSSGAASSAVTRTIAIADGQITGGLDGEPLGENNLSITDPSGQVTYVSTLEEACEQAVSGSTITVLADYTDGSTFSLEEGDKRTLTLDMNGKTITVPDEDNDGYADGGIAVGAGSLTITGNGSYNSLINYWNASLTIENGTFGLIYGKGQPAILKSGTFSGLDIGLGEEVEALKNVKLALLYVAEDKDSAEAAKNAVLSALPEGKQLTKEIVVLENADKYLVYCEGPVSVVDSTPDTGGTISGTVSDTANAAVAGAAVRIVKKAAAETTVATTTTDELGTYRITNIPYGIYSLIVTKEDRINTDVITINSPSTTQNVTLLSGQKNTVVEIAGTDVPPAAVGNLAAMFEGTEPAGQKTEIKLVLTDKTTDKPDQSLVAAKLTSREKIGYYFDLQLIKTVDKGSPTAIQPPSGQHLTITLDLPPALQNKAPYALVKVHDGIAEKTSAAYDAVTQTLTFDADKFSTYAIAYTAKSSGGSGGGGGSSAVYHEITVSPAEHGSVSPEGTVSVQAGSDKTFTFTPDQGYEISDVLVDGVRVGAQTRYTFTDLRQDHTLQVIFALSGSQTTAPAFTDVSPSDWFYAPVLTAVQKGWFAGTSTDTFSPNLSTTRGMITTVLWRMAGQPAAAAASPFTDVTAGSWYYDGITWAQVHDIVSGYDNGLFGPEDAITREQLAAILYRYACFKGYDVSAKAPLDRFTDGRQTSPYALETVQWAVAAGLLTGKGNGLLAPQATATRAEAAAILTRFAALYGEQ